MSLKTQNLELVKPLSTEFYNIDVQNTNLDKIDEVLFGVKDWKDKKMHQVTTENGNTKGEYPVGISYSIIDSTNKQQASQDGTMAFPIEGTLVTSKLGASNFTQTIYGKGSGIAYMRSYNVESGFSDWEKIATTNYVEDKTDLEYLITETNGNTYASYPIGVSYSTIKGENYEQTGQTVNTNFPSFGTLMTINHSPARFMQLLQFSGSAASDNVGLYARSQYNGVFRPWRRLDSGNREKNSDFTLSVLDMNCFIRVIADFDITMTIPNNDAVAIPIATDITICQENVGILTISCAEGVILHTEDSYTKSDGRYTAFTLRKIGENEWVAIGRLSD